MCVGRKGAAPRRYYRFPLSHRTRKGARQRLGVFKHEGKYELRRMAPWVTLGRVTERGYEPLREASSDIAGPVALSTGTLVALAARSTRVRTWVLAADMTPAAVGGCQS